MSDDYGWRTGSNVSDDEWDRLRKAYNLPDEIRRGINKALFVFEVKIKSHERQITIRKLRDSLEKLQRDCLELNVFVDRLDGAVRTEIEDAAYRSGLNNVDKIVRPLADLQSSLRQIEVLAELAIRNAPEPGKGKRLTPTPNLSLAALLAGTLERETIAVSSSKTNPTEVFVSLIDFVVGKTYQGLNRHVPGNAEDGGRGIARRYLKEIAQNG